MRFTHETNNWIGRLGVFEGLPSRVDSDRFADFYLTSDEGALLVGEIEHVHPRFTKLSVGL
jgi:hypothetical protein